MDTKTSGEIVREGYRLAVRQFRVVARLDWTRAIDQTPEEAVTRFLDSEGLSPSEWERAFETIHEAYSAYREWYFYGRRGDLTLKERFERFKSPTWGEIPF